MNGLQGGKVQNIEKPFPGCLGRMVNRFDLSAGINRNKLLADKPHLGGFLHTRSRSDVASMSSPPSGDHIEDRVVVSDLRRTASNKANSTPVKKLIAQEMSKEVASKHNPTNVVAKLMGLDTLPQQLADTLTPKRNFKGYSQCSSSEAGISMERLEHDCGLENEQMHCGTRWCQDHNRYKDVYEVWQQPSDTNYTRDSLPRGGRYDEYSIERKMAFVRQKFMEAKHLTTHEKLDQSKEFQDALDVLSSNRDLFLKFLQESDSLFSEHLYDFQSISSHPEMRRITVLRPSKMADEGKTAVPKNKNDRKKSPTAIQGTGWDGDNPRYCPPFFSPKVEENPAQPTRIIVLKPSPGKAHGIKAVVSSYPSSSRIQDDGFFEEPEDVESRESREVAKEITRQMRENLMGHRRDETLLSSVYSNGYTGDESSFNKLGDEFIAGNLSDSEIPSPTSRQSWEFGNRYGSPYSCSPLSHSYSPESSVCREAKKRLSERWALMASNGCLQEQQHVRKSSSTLGEMLALSDMKKSVRSQEGNKETEQEARASTSCLASNMNVEGTSDSLKLLLRSKSVPMSSTAYGDQLDVENPTPVATKAQVPAELAKPRIIKSSLRGRVSSLFFSRNKKFSKEKSDASQSEGESQKATPELIGSPVIYRAKTSDFASLCIKDGGLQDCLSPDLRESASRTALQDILGTGPSQEAGVSVAKPMMRGNEIENQDQPSPISVLQPFEEDDHTIPDHSRLIQPAFQGDEVSLRSNLIGKSPPIGSIARTLSWDDTCTETSTHHPCAEEDQDWHGLVHALLSAADLHGEVQSDSFLARWNSPDSPLDPSLRDKYATLYDKELIHEAKRRQQRSNRKLVFDCVDAMLMEITGHSSDRSNMAASCNKTYNRQLHSNKPFTLVDYVWAQMKDWLEVQWASGEAGDASSLVVEMVVREDVTGKWWAENMRMEFDDVGIAIEGKLMEELVEEAVVELTSRP